MHEIDLETDVLQSLMRFIPQCQIQIVGFNFAPRNWALAAGQIMAISQNQALFALIGTTYGGNGTSNFQLPDLRGRTPIGPIQ